MIKKNIKRWRIHPKVHLRVGYVLRSLYNVNVSGLKKVLTLSNVDRNHFQGINKLFLNVGNNQEFTLTILSAQNFLLHLGGISFWSVKMGGGGPK